MVLIDTTAWIDLLRRRATRQVGDLRALLGTREAALSFLVYQEVLQGASTPDHFERLRGYFSTLPILHVDSPRRLHEVAARLCARCRRAGITPRNGHDCVMAQTAIEHDVALLANGRDFDAIAAVEPRLRFFRPGRA